MNSSNLMLAKSDRSLSPIIPATSQRMPEQAIDFNEWHHKKTEWINQDNRVEQLARWRKWQENLNFFIGLQLIWWNGNMESGYWKNAELEEGDPYYASNIFQAYINSLIAELYRSNPRLTVSAKTDQWRDIEAATVAKHVLEQEMNRLWTDEQKLRSLFFYIVFGNVFWYTTWIPEGGPMVKIPQYSQENIVNDSRFGICPSCGIQKDLAGFDSEPTTQGLILNSMGQPTSTPGSPMSSSPFPSPSPSPMCPNCNEPLQMQGQRSEMQMPVFKGEQEQESGDTQLFIIDPTQVKLQLNARSYLQSAYLDVKTWMLIDEARMIYGENINFSRPNGKEYESQRSFIRQNELVAGNLTGMGAWGTHDTYMSRNSSPDEDITCISQSWLRPSQYWHVILKNPIETEKYQIPAGVALREVFPKGMVLTKNNNILLDLDDRQINKHWNHLRYQTVATKIWGDSVAENLVQGQREYNETRSIELENYCHNATPATIVNPKKIKPTNISGKARGVISMENTSKSDDNPANFIYTGQARQLGGDIPNFKQGIKGDMQLMSGAPVGESGIPGASADTATGMQILRDYTNSKLAIRIAPINSALKNQSSQILELIQQYWIGNRYIKISNEVGLDDGKWFQGADIRGSFDIGIRPGSDRPVSSMELKDNLLQFLVAGGVPFGGLNEAFPRQAGVILSRELGLPMDLDRFTMHARKQRDEIDDIKFALKMAKTKVQQQLDPAMTQAAIQDPMLAEQIQMQQQQALIQGALQAVPVEFSDDDAAHVETINYYLNTDTGRKEPPEVKQALELHATLHEQAQAQKQFKKMMLATGGGMFPMQQPPMGANGKPDMGGAQQQQQGGQANKQPQPKPQKEM